MKAGFWVRFAALWLDAVVVYGCVSVIEKICSLFNFYVPFELTFFIFAPAYLTIFTWLRGQTPGKMLCGLTVIRKDDRPCGFFRSFLRETLGKLLSGIIFSFGFLWAGLTRSKRGWHDYLAQTKVIGDSSLSIRRKFILGGILLIIGAYVCLKGLEFDALYNEAERMTLAHDVTTRYANRDPSTLREVSSLREADQKELSDWLDRYGNSPINYAIDVARKHRLTIFGEIHGEKDYLLFLNEIIPGLYHHAGVTCLALEICVAEDNQRLEKLVTGDQFDRDLALQIARNTTVEMWGIKEQWDVLETVWKLNQSIPPGEKKMRVVGIDTKWDGMSLALLGAGGGNDTVHGPIWEKLRILRCGLSIFRILKRDELMASNVEREIVRKGERGVVWVGWNHDFINYRQPVVWNGKLTGEWDRMGFKLHQKYGDEVFQIRLHGKDASPSAYYVEYHGAQPQFSDYIEHALKMWNKGPVGFDVEESPLASVRDSNTDYYHFQPRVSFSDVASGYIYLKPLKDLVPCTWINGYVTPEMFIRNKPVYELAVGHSLRNANEADSELYDFVKTNLSK